MTDIQLTPREYEALLERLGPDAKDTPGDRDLYLYHVHLHPVTFWVNAEKWERHKLHALLAKLSSGWKDTLTEPTLQKLRALLAEPPAESMMIEREDG